MLAYDLETGFLKKGFKRPTTRILEVGIYNQHLEYQALINPCKAYDTGKAIIQDLEVDHNPESTLRFWTKLLVQKGHLNTALKRADTNKQADAISELLVRSDKARKHDKPKDMLYALKCRQSRRICQNKKMFGTKRSVVF